MNKKTARTLRRLDSNGDTVLAEYDVETKKSKINGRDGGLGKNEIAELEALFKKELQSGHTAFDVTDQKNEQIRAFDPESDILLVPMLQGGALRTFSIMNHEGDGKLYEYDDADDGKVNEANNVFDATKRKGYAPFDAQNEQMLGFRKDTDVLFVPQIQGGSR